MRVSLRGRGAVLFPQGSMRSRVAAVALAVIAAYTAVVVVLAISSGRSHAAVFWPTVTLMALVVLFGARLAFALWVRSRNSASNDVR